VADPISLILLVAVGEASTGQARALVEAARETLTNVAVQTLETRGLPDDDGALAVERAAHAAALVELVWTDAGHRVARVRVHLAASRRWVERSFAFGPADPPSEQGRAMGFAVATMLPVAGGRSNHLDGPPDDTGEGRQGSGDVGPVGSASPTGAAAAPTAPNPAPAAASPDTATAGSRGSSPEAAATNGRGVSSERPDFEPVVPRVGGAATSGLALQILAVGAGGEAGGFGAEGALLWFPVPFLGARIAGGARSGTLDAAQATSLLCGGSIGARLRPWPATRDRPVEALLGVDYLLNHVSLTHFDDDEPAPVTMGRWLSGADLRLDLSWRLSSLFDLLVSAAVEDDFAATRVSDKGVAVAILPAIRGVGLGGIQVRF
jgi:hypothetical protein